MRWQSESADIAIAPAPLHRCKSTNCFSISVYSFRSRAIVNAKIAPIGKASNRL